MKVNVIITPKKNEVIECDECTCYDGSVVLLKVTGRGKAKKINPVAGFKKWIRFYVLPEEKSVRGKRNANQS